MKKSELIRTYCTGCGLCHSVNGDDLIKIKGGFPNVNIIEQSTLNFCEKVCPISYYENDNYQDIWGNIEKAIIGYSTDEKIRYMSSSGGALTEISVYLIENHLVDGIIHTTFNPTSPTENVTCISHSAEEVRSRLGSRYSISMPLYKITQMIDLEKKYAFIGKPCDVMALRNYLKINSSLKKNFEYLLSFFCAGEPSVTAQERLLKKMNSKVEDCKTITYRGNGWPGYTTVIKKDGSIEKLEYQKAWGQYLGRDLRYTCRFCLDGTGEAADIVCADFWYLNEEGNPDFSEHDGRNIVIARNKKASMLLNDVVELGNLHLEEDFTSKINELYKYQPHQYKRKSMMKSLLLAMKICGKKAPKYNKSILNRYAKHMTINKRLKFIVGSIKRIVLGKI